MKAALLSFWILVSLSQTLRALSAATEIVISVPDQQLAVIDRGKLLSKYAISTSKFGLGDGNGCAGWNNRTVARAIVAFTFTARQRNAGLELPRASAVSGCAQVT